jgi:hypothetical protein
VRIIEVAVGYELQFGDQGRVPAIDEFINGVSPGDTSHEEVFDQLSASLKEFI